MSAHTEQCSKWRECCGKKFFVYIIGSNPEQSFWFRFCFCSGWYLAQRAAVEIDVGDVVANSSGSSAEC